MCVCVSYVFECVCVSGHVCDFPLSVSVYVCEWACVCVSSVCEFVCV